MSEKILGYHFCREDFTARYGSEKPFEVGEYRKLSDDREIKLCEWGYHGCVSPYEALVGSYIYGSVVELCEFDEPILNDTNKFVSRGKKLIARANVRTPLILFAADCAERVLPIFEKRHPNDKRVRDCIEGVRRFSRGEISRDELLKLRSAAAAAYADTAAAAAAYAAYAANDADTAAAYAAAYAAYAANDADTAAAAANAANDAAGAAAERQKERDWQGDTFNKLIVDALGVTPPKRRG